MLFAGDELDGIESDLREYHAPAARPEGHDVPARDRSVRLDPHQAVHRCPVEPAAPMLANLAIEIAEAVHAVRTDRHPIARALAFAKARVELALGPCLMALGETSLRAAVIV